MKTSNPRWDSPPRTAEPIVTAHVLRSATKSWPANLRQPAPGYRRSSRTAIQGTRYRAASTARRRFTVSTPRTECMRPRPDSNVRRIGYTVTISRSGITAPIESARRSHRRGHRTYRGHTRTVWNGVRGTSGAPSARDGMRMSPRESLRGGPWGQELGAAVVGDELAVPAPVQEGLEHVLRGVAPDPGRDRLEDLLAGQGAPLRPRHLGGLPEHGDVLHDVPEDRLPASHGRAEDLPAEVREAEVPAVHGHHPEEFRRVHDGAEAVHVHVDLPRDHRDVRLPAHLVDGLRQPDDLAEGDLPDRMDVHGAERHGTPNAVWWLRHFANLLHTMSP